MYDAVQERIAAYEHANRCSRGGDGGSSAERIRPRSQPLPYGEGVRLAPHLGAPCAQQRRQTTQKGKTEQRQHAGGGSLAYGSALAASQPDRLGSVLSQARSTAEWRYCGVRHRQKVGHSDLPAAALGPAVHGRRCGGIRKTLPPAACEKLSGQGQRPWL